MIPVIVERRSLLSISCLQSNCDVVKICDHLLICLIDFRRIRMKYGIDLILPIGLIRQKFYGYACIS